MKISKRLLQLMQAKKWTRYRLAKECGVYITTVNAWLKEDYCPSVESLQSICNAFGITMVEFFSGIEENNLTTDQLVLLEKYNNLSQTNRNMIIGIMDIMLKQ